MAVPSDIDRSAPVIANHRITIEAPRDLVWKLHTDVDEWPTWQTDITEAARDQPLRPGAPFRWTTFGMAITSTVYALDEGTRILWGGASGDITGIHEWTFADTSNGVEVTTTESFSGPAVAADPATMQTLLDQSLSFWLEQLKVAAESRV